MLYIHDLQDFNELKGDAASGCCEARFELAKHCLYGSQYEEQNTNKGFGLLVKSALTNYSQAKMLLAKIYADGFAGDDGVVLEQDKPLAFSMFDQLRGDGQLTSENRAKATEKLALLYRDKSIQTYKCFDPDHANELSFMYMEQAALEGSLSAQYEQGMMYKNGIGVEQNIGLAQYMLERSANLGYEPALLELNMNQNIYS